MELEDVHSDLCSLKKLYGLIRGSQDGVQMSGFLDERARVLLKNLLDAATEKALLAYSKIIADAQSGVSNTHYSSQPVQPKTVPYFEPPISANTVKASPSTIQSSNANSNFCASNAWKGEQSLIKPTPQDAGSEHSKFSVALQKSESRKKVCRVCKRSSMKLQNSAKKLNEDGNGRDQQQDEAHWINGDAKGSLELKLQDLKPAVTCSEETRQKRNPELQCQPSVPCSASCASSSLGTRFVKTEPGFLSGQIGKHREDTKSNFSKEVESAVKSIESGTSSSPMKLYDENVDSLKANNAACNLSLSLSKAERDGSVAMSEMSHARRKNGDSSDAMRKSNQAKRQNVREIVERIESLHGASSQKNYKKCQKVHGLVVPLRQEDVVKKSSMPGVKVRQDPSSRNPVGRLERESRVSVTSIPLSTGSMVPTHKRNLPPQPFITPTLLDYDDRHRRSTPKRSHVGTEEELDEAASSSSNPRSQELSDETASSSSNPHSPELSDATASSSSNPRSPEESYETASSSSSPHSSNSWASQQQTTGSSRGSDEGLEDYYEHGDPPPRVIGRGHSKRYRSPSPKKKATGRLRGLKNKLGLIFHHHHHHHHHHHDGKNSEKAPTRSMWNNLHRMFQHKDLKHHDKAYQKKAVVVSNKKQQAGHFQAFVKGLLKHAKHSKKSKPSKGRIGRQIRHAQNGHDNKNWWKMLQRHRQGVKLHKKGRVKLELPRKSKKPQLKALK